MCLKDLISWLEKQNPDHVVPHGFANPHSYRGDYYDLAFEPKENARLGDMLTEAKAALGQTFDGYKGGEFTMGEYTNCWISEYGACGSADGIGATLLKLWELTAYDPQHTA